MFTRLNVTKSSHAYKSYPKSSLSPNSCFRILASTEIRKGKEMQGTANIGPMKGAQKVESHVWGRVRSGFMMFLPILVTYLVLRFLIGYTDGLLAPLVNLLPFNAPGLSLLLLFVIFYIAGLVVSPRVGKMTVAAQHAIFSRIPVVKNIYGLTEKVAGHLSAYGDFSRVVLVEWPRPNVFAVGFVTGKCELKGDVGDRVAIYIPTVPNPTSGMFALMNRSEVFDTDISVEEALNLVLSGGIVLPDKLQGVDIKARLKNQGEAEDAQEQFSITLNEHRNRRRGYNGYNYRNRQELYRASARSVEERW